MPRPRKNKDEIPAAVGLDVLNTPDAPLPKDVALREFYTIATGKEAPDGNLTREHLSEIEFSQNLVERLGAIGLATMTSLALRGHARAAQFLVEKCIGTLRQPFGEAVQGLTLEKAEELLFLEYTQTLKLSPETARKMIAATKTAEGAAPKEVRAITAPGMIEAGRD